MSGWTAIAPRAGVIALSRGQSPRLAPRPSAVDFKNQRRPRLPLPSIVGPPGCGDDRMDPLSGRRSALKRCEGVLPSNFNTRRGKSIVNEVDRPDAKER